MSYRLPLLTLLVLMSFLVSSQSAPQDPAETQKPLYQRSGHEANLVGMISVKGAIPKTRLFDMSADPICVEDNTRPEVDSLITNEDKLVNVFLYVKKSELLQTYRFEAPESEVVLHRKNCYFSPHVVGLRVGQRLSIVNADRTVHNTHPTPRLNVEWNATQMPGTTLTRTFTRPEQLIPFKCNQHPWERAFVGVMDHPFFAVSDQFGNYEIRGLPPGTYTLVAWHEQLGEQQLELTVGGGEIRRVDFTFDTKKASSLGP